MLHKKSAAAIQQLNQLLLRFANVVEPLLQIIAALFFIYLTSYTDRNDNSTKATK